MNDEHSADTVTVTLSAKDFEVVLNGLGSALAELDGLRLPENVAYRDDLTRVLGLLQECVTPPAEEGQADA